MRLLVKRQFRNEGTVVLFESTDEHGERVVFAADHRPARDIVEALEGDEPVYAEVEAWQVIGTPGHDNA